MITPSALNCGIQIMTIKDTNIRYGYISMLNHWLGVTLMLSLLLFGWSMEEYESQWAEISSSELHISMGISLLLLTIIRFAWRTTNTTPPYPAAMPDWQKRVSRLMKYSLYATMIALSITGWILVNADGQTVSVFGLFNMPDIAPRSYGLEEMMEETHEVLVSVFLFLAGMHILAAIKHHFFDKDYVLTSMLPRKKL